MPFNKINQIKPKHDNNIHSVSKLVNRLFNLSFEFSFFHFTHDRSIGLPVSVFAKGSGDWGSIPGLVKLQKMVLDASLLSTQHYKVRIKGCRAIQGKE